MNETLASDSLMFEVRRSSRWKALGLTVDRHGELLVHAPEGDPNRHIETWAHSKLLWVHRRLAAKEWLTSALREPEFVSGESFSVLGRRYPLRIDPVQAEPLRFDGAEVLPEYIGDSRGDTPFSSVVHRYRSRVGAESGGLAVKEGRL